MNVGLRSRLLAPWHRLEGRSWRRRRGARARGAVVAQVSPTPSLDPRSGVRAPSRGRWCESGRCLQEALFRSPMMNAPVDRVVPTFVARISETEGAPAKSLMAGHMAPFIGKPRPQVGLAAIKRSNPIATAKPMVPTPDKLYFVFSTPSARVRRTGAASPGWTA